MRDVHKLDGKLDKFAFLGPPYPWPQYLAALPGDCHDAIFNQPYRDGKLGEYLEIHSRRQAKQVNCLIGHGIPPETGQYAHSARDDLTIRPGMCIQFYTNPTARQGSAVVIDAGSIDAIKYMLGVVIKAKSVNGPVDVQLLLARENLLPCLQWPSLDQDQVFHTDIRMEVPLDDINSVVRVCHTSSTSTGTQEILLASLNATSLSWHT
jgi:hypothetical protein